MPKVEIYTKSWCPFCARAKQHLDSNGVAFEEIDVTADTVREIEMVKRARRTSVPQIFIDDVHVGGSDDLLEADRNGRLAQLLAGEQAGEVA